MANLRKVLFVSLCHFRRWPTNPRMYLLLILLAGYINMMLYPVRDFCAQYNVAISPWVFPYLMAEPYSLLMVMLGIVLLFCDAPFLDEEQPYVILRAGRLCWCAAQILYMDMATIVYFLVVFLLTVVLLLPCVQFSADWGVAINTLAQTDLGFQAGVALPFPSEIMLRLSPLQAIGAELGMASWIGVFLGLVMFTLNALFNRGVGAIAATAFAVFPLFIRQTDWGLHYFSPVSWASLVVLDFSGNTTMPSVYYAAGVLAVACATLILLDVWIVKKQNIEVIKSI